MHTPSTHGLEVFATELAHDVLREAILWPHFLPVLHPRCHRLDFVLDEREPVLGRAVEVALQAVEVIGLTILVGLHVFLSLERHGTRGNGAGEWFEWSDRLDVWHVDDLVTLLR